MKIEGVGPEVLFPVSFWVIDGEAFEAVDNAVVAEIGTVETACTSRDAPDMTQDRPRMI